MCKFLLYSHSCTLDSLMLRDRFVIKNSDFSASERTSKSVSKILLHVLIIAPVLFVAKLAKSLLKPRSANISAQAATELSVLCLK